MAVWGAVRAVQHHWYWWILTAVFLWYVFSWAGRSNEKLPKVNPKQDRFLQVVAGVGLLLIIGVIFIELMK